MPWIAKIALLSFAVVFAYKLIANSTRLLMVVYYRKKYTQYLLQKCPDFAVYTHSLKKLFIRAGVAEGGVEVPEAIGGGLISTHIAPLYENMDTVDPRIIGMMENRLLKAKGAFRTRIFECFSPIYWIEAVIFLPRNILAFLGIPQDKAIVKVFQLLYWLLAPAAVIFREQIYGFISELFRNMQ